MENRDTLSLGELVSAVQTHLELRYGPEYKILVKQVIPSNAVPGNLDVVYDIEKIHEARDWE